MGVLCGVFIGVGLNDPGHPESDTRAVSGDAVAAAVSSKYEITSIEGTDALTTKASITLLGGSNSGNIDALTERLCTPVDTNSYEFTGVANGQEIRFRAGFEDCRHPDPQIVITSTPGQAVSPDDLKRD